jgi:anthranilate synthase/aminodeoxychorismate synthase-like glutamine amidotransferase
VILVIDNYDSFVHNVTRYLRELGAEAEISRNDALNPDSLGGTIDGIVISPGPCTPREAGVSLDVIRKHSGTVPILGICLGHQCIGEAFGGHIARAKRPLHGEASTIRHDGKGVLSGIPDGFNAGRYHSLIVELEGDEPLAVTARSEEGEIMALEHKSHPTFGVQFHPESVLTEHGYDILRNFLKATAQ